MDKTQKLSGLVVSGVHKASFFTQLDWVQEQCMEKLGFRPHPGTLNLNMAVLEENQPTVQDLRKEDGIKLIPSDPNFYAATVLPVYLGEVKGAIVIPAEDVNVHGKEIIEVLAPLRLRDTLGVNDGDLVTLVIDRCLGKQER
ncbi:MAG: CTP-dependent riboflavin kinase [Deltaproteobacteria bacterium]|nr:CTP-dependent riboflavin kinase [Deltaproteobacteria bacterium]